MQFPVIAKLSHVADRVWSTILRLRIAAVLALILPVFPDPSLFLLNDRSGMF